jgi:hypothetical protein
MFSSYLSAGLLHLNLSSLGYFIAMLPATMIDIQLNIHVYLIVMSTSVCLHLLVDIFTRPRVATGICIKTCAPASPIGLLSKRTLRSVLISSMATHIAKVLEDVNPVYNTVSENIRVRERKHNHGKNYIHQKRQTLLQFDPPLWSRYSSFNVLLVKRALPSASPPASANEL